MTRVTLYIHTLLYTLLLSLYRHNFLVFPLQVSRSGVAFPKTHPHPHPLPPGSGPAETYKHVLQNEDPGPWGEEENPDHQGGVFHTLKGHRKLWLHLSIHTFFFLLSSFASPHPQSLGLCVPPPLLSDLHQIWSQKIWALDLLALATFSQWLEEVI